MKNALTRRLVVAAVAIAALGTTAPQASARCAPPNDPVDPIVCYVGCTVARAIGAACKAGA